MTRVASVTLYTFDELSDTGKARVRENFRRDWQEGGEADHYLRDEFDSTHGYPSEQAKEHGFYNIEWNYSLGYSQDDGASFTGSIDVALYMRAHKLIGKNRALWHVVKEGYVSGVITRISSHYAHEYTCEVELDDVFDWDNEERHAKLREQVAAVTAHITETYRELCRAGEKAGYAILEQYDKDAAIDEYMQDYGDDGETFYDEDGDRWDGPVPPDVAYRQLGAPCLLAPV